MQLSEFSANHKLKNFGSSKDSDTNIVTYEKLCLVRIDFFKYLIRTNSLRRIYTV